jgi:uncharacterized protein (DUF427 family)
MRRSSRHVRVERERRLLAESSRAILLFETGLPRASTCRARTWCSTCDPGARQTLLPYKGQASYWSRRGGRAPAPDLAWSYEDPLQDATPW